MGFSLDPVHSVTLAEVLAPLLLTSSVTGGWPRGEPEAARRLLGEPSVWFQRFHGHPGGPPPLSPARKSGLCLLLGECQPLMPGLLRLSSCVGSFSLHVSMPWTYLQQLRMTVQVASVFKVLVLLPACTPWGKRGAVTCPLLPL